MAGAPESGTTGVDAARLEDGGFNALQPQRQLFHDGRPEEYR